MHSEFNPSDNGVKRPRRLRLATLIETSRAGGRGIIHGIARYQQEHRRPWSLLAEANDLIDSWPRRLSSTRIAGAISRVRNQEFADFLVQNRIPAVDVCVMTDRQGLPRVRPDQAAVGRLGARHLIERGFRQFASCGTEELWSYQRNDAFHELARSSGRVLDGYVGPRFDEPVENETWGGEDDGLLEWLLRLPKPIGIYASSDWHGRQILNACSDAGFDVPRDVAVIGTCDDPLWCELASPGLSSVKVDFDGVGYLAAQLLDRMLVEGSFASPEVLTLVPPLGITTRLSTDILAIDDLNMRRALDIIQSRACEGLTVSDVLAAVPMSRSSMERRFRKYFGCSPQAMIQQVALRKVEELLTTTELGLEEISRRAGYKHSEHMHAVFKRLKGITPGTYRRQVRAAAVSNAVN